MTIDSRQGQTRWGWLFQPVDNASLVIFRISFGLIMLWEVGRFLKENWIRTYYISPKFYFKYFGFEWVQPWPGEGMYYHFAAVGLLAFCITFGVFYRIATVLFFLGFSYWYLLDQTRYLNHLYLCALIAFLMIFLPCHRAKSFDAWLRPSIRSNQAPRWALWAVRFQIGLVYFYAGIAKLASDWLAGEPMRK